MTSKQRAYLKGLANSEQVILTVGKDGVGPQVIKQADDALQAREIIKMRCLDNSALSVKEAAAQIARMCGADVVQTIGSVAVLYRASATNPRIHLPD